MSIATNQSVESRSAVRTPGAIPNQAITIGTIKGNKIAPVRGVNATNQRNILFVGTDVQNHASSLGLLGLVLSTGVVR